MLYADECPYRSRYPRVLEKTICVLSDKAASGDLSIIPSGMENGAEPLI